MHYQHEEIQRLNTKTPMCTEYPPGSPNEKDWEHMEAYLESRDLDVTLARKNGWYPSRQAGDSFLRVVIPARTHKAGHVYWQARALSPKAYLRYQSPPGPRHEAIIVIEPAEPVGTVIVEGPMCALRAAMHGYIGIALMGAVPNEATLRHVCLVIESHKRLPIVVLLDRDSGNASVRVSTFLASQGYLNIVGRFVNSKDLTELSLHDSTKLLRRCFRTINSSMRKCEERRF